MLQFCMVLLLHLWALNFSLTQAGELFSNLLLDNCTLASSLELSVLVGDNFGSITGIAGEHTLGDPSALEVEGGSKI